VSIVRVEHVSHFFGKLQVLSDVSFSVGANEVLGFIGPNGAGKTTTLRMLATLLEPHYGRILIDGVDVLSDPAHVRRNIGFMPDGFGVYERTTVHEYLEFFSAAYGVPREARARTMDAVMELTDLGKLRDRMVSSMSKGMKQRLCIARTLLNDPKVLIFDEPANGLDPRARIEMRDLIEQLRGMGKTIILSSHILTELSDMVTSVVVLEAGRVRAAGPIGAVASLDRQAEPQRVLRLRLLRAAGALTPEHLDALRAVEGVLGIDRSPDGDLRVAYRGEDHVVADLVDAAVRTGLRVTRVEPERDDLEQLFMEVTRGELQ
jgi:ABC-2 type transport system ATP-binding protein